MWFRDEKNVFFRPEKFHKKSSEKIEAGKLRNEGFFAEQEIMSMVLLLIAPSTSNEKKLCGVIVEWYKSTQSIEMLFSIPRTWVRILPLSLQISLGAPLGAHYTENSART